MPPRVRSPNVGPIRSSVAQPVAARASGALSPITAPASWPTIDLSALAVIERLLVRTPVRMLRARNNVLDVLFYDVDALPPAVRHRLLRWSDPDGSIVVVCPGDARHREVHHYEHVEDFLASPWNTADIVAIAGVGSSALGTAALAANVADARRCPVIGIVSGYGVVDAVAEAMTGWFVLRAASQLRQWGEWWSRLLVPLLSRISEDTQPNGDAWRLVSYVRGLPEGEALDWLLVRAPIRPALLVGHSKGNLSIAQALAQLPPDLARVLCPSLGVVTIGALVPLPESLAAARQLIGALDMFGLMNSLLPQKAELVSGAMHTTNTRAPFAVHVEGELARPFDARGGTSSSSRRGSTTALPWQLASAAAIAFQAAVSECVRSIIQGAEHARRKARAGRARRRS